LPEFRKEGSNRVERSEKLVIEIRTQGLSVMLLLLLLLLFSFFFIIISHMEQFLNKVTATITAANYISTNKRIIKHSIEAAKKEAITHTKNILHWLKLIKEGGHRIIHIIFFQFYIYLRG